MKPLSSPLRLAALSAALAGWEGAKERDGPVDADGDGIWAAQDCDDADDALESVADDADCDGVAAAEDCDDTNPEAAQTADDADCDGVATASDCDDTNAAAWDGGHEVASGNLDSGFSTFCHGKCTRGLAGNLDLSAASPEELASLFCLTSVGGHLEIHDNPALRSLSGLDALSFVGKDLDIEYNDALTSLSSLESLSFVGEDVEIYENLSLCDDEAAALCDDLGSGLGGSCDHYNNDGSCP